METPSFPTNPAQRQRQTWRSKWRATRRQWRKGQKLYYPNLNSTSGDTRHRRDRHGGTRKCSVRQSCPMSTLLFIMVLNPLTSLSEQHLTGIRTGHRTTKTAVVAHADDVTILVTVPADIQTIVDLILTYQRATGIH